jgi:hypothetical protein
LNLDVKQQEKLKQLLPSKATQKAEMKRKENKPRRKMGKKAKNG